MMDIKKTLKKLHQNFPNLNTDELLLILDCIEEEPHYSFRDFQLKTPEHGNFINTNTFKPYVYLYNISENILMRFESNISEICRKLEEMNFHINRTSFDKVLKNKQKQAGGFIMAYSVNELISKVLNYNAESCQNIFNLAKENNYLNEQDLINWQDKLNEISISY